MINVLEQIRPLLTFESDDDFYFLQIIQRSKENENLSSNSRVIKIYYIRSLEYLDKKWEEIKQLSDIFNARAMICLNKRSYRRVALKTLQNIANTMDSGNCQAISNSYSKACGQTHNAKLKTWIIDVDNPTIGQDLLDTMRASINECRPDGDKIIMTLPTKNGFHIITHPFDIQQFNEFGWDVDIHKNNPINLYIP
jgi:hypothetical protein